MPENASAVELRDTPPFKHVIIYNQSRHASNSVLSDIKSVWGDKIHVVMTVEDDATVGSTVAAANVALPGVHDVIKIEPGTWGNLDHFKARLDQFESQKPHFRQGRVNGDVVFMAGWSAFAESAETARYVQDHLGGVVWPGTEPNASDRLEKIGFKKICDQVGAPTPPFTILSEEGNKVDLNDAGLRQKVIDGMVEQVLAMKSETPGLIKSIHGGGGKGTAHVHEPMSRHAVQASVEQVLNEMKRTDGIYFEQKVNTKGSGRFYQLELECDGTTVANGGRFVWFNSRLQKVVEIGLSDTYLKELSGKHDKGDMSVPYFMPYDLYEKSRKWASDIAKVAGNNTRATMEALVYEEQGEWKINFIECNRRPQVENEALGFLECDRKGNRRYTFAELMMRAKGYSGEGVFKPVPDHHVALHARWLHGDPDSNGMITYKTGSVRGIQGPFLPYVKSELLPWGDISFKADPQLGKSVICASDWGDMCTKAVEYFTLRKPVVVGGESSTYSECMRRLFGNPKFISGDVASNETFSAIAIPESDPVSCASAVRFMLHGPVGDIMVDGYRPGEGVQPDTYPAESVVKAVETLDKTMCFETPRETAYTKFARGDIAYEEYIGELRAQLRRQGGGWVTVAPRDTCQQGMDSESASIQDISRRNAELYAERAGCVGYEVGGAQYQAGLIRGFNPAKILQTGLPHNMAAHSLQRSQYVNGLCELDPSSRARLFTATAELVQEHYGTTGNSAQKTVPWIPYNFHAGNYWNPETGVSAQDDTTRQLLDAKIMPMPNWVFSPKFSLDQLETWVNRQIDLFESNGRKLHQIRIKNPGQGEDWTVENIWDHVSIMRKVFKERGLDEPILYIHNHDFNGLGGHIARGLLMNGKRFDYPYLVIDGGYRKNGTHNDNTVFLDALNLDEEQRSNLATWAANQQQIERLLVRFDSRDSQFTPWNSDWAGGTEGSDIRIAKEYQLPNTDIEHAKVLASDVFPLERAVTPFSEYKLRLGIAMMIEPAIMPKTPKAAKSYVENGGKLKVGGDVLVGLKKWETLVDRPKIVLKLLDNMQDELLAAEQALAKPFQSSATDPARVFTEVGFQQKGRDLYEGRMKDLTPMLYAPWVLHGAPLSTPAVTTVPLATSTGRQEVVFDGFSKRPDTMEMTMKFVNNGEEHVVVKADPTAVSVGGAAEVVREATENEFGMPVPGEILTFDVEPGDKLEEGEPFITVESMKMETKITVPAELSGAVVKELIAKPKTLMKLKQPVLSFSRGFSTAAAFQGTARIPTASGFSAQRVSIMGKRMLRRLR